MVNKTWDSLEVQCRLQEKKAGLASLQYNYTAVLTNLKLNTSRLLTFPAPEFRLSQLEAGTEYSISLYVENQLGPGPAITLLAQTHRLAEKRTAESKIALQAVSEEASQAGPTTDLVLVVLGASAGLVLVLCCVLTTTIFLLNQRRRLDQAQDSSSLGSNHSSLEIDSEYTQYNLTGFTLRSFPLFTPIPVIMKEAFRRSKTKGKLILIIK